MKDKFIVVDCMGIKQVGFDGAMGVSTLDVEQIVQRMNGFNNTCERLENNIEALSKDKTDLVTHAESLEKDVEVCWKYIQVLEKEIEEIKESCINS